jgi:hypothetical protein
MKAQVGLGQLNLSNNNVSSICHATVPMSSEAAQSDESEAVTHHITVFEHHAELLVRILVLAEVESAARARFGFRRL